ncbi:hypothetical protein Tco_0060316 [Tanacetum coccineum]
MDTEVPQPIGPTDNIAMSCVSQVLETMKDTIAQTRSENVSKLSKGSTARKRNRHSSDEDSLNFMKL